jgi:hypothetical protein
MARTSTDVAEQTSLLDRIRQGDVKAARDAGFAALAATATDVSEAEAGGLDAAQMGDGYVVVPTAHKEHLVGMPFIIVEYDLNFGRKVEGTYFTTLHIVTERPVNQIRPGCTTFILNDGSTGIHRQLMELRGKDGDIPRPMLCRNGLRVSEYDVTENETDPETGEPILDEVTGKPKQKAVVNPISGQKVTGKTYYIDDAL